VSIHTAKILRRHLLGMAAALQEEIEKEEREKKSAEKRDPAQKEEAESSARSL